MTDINVSYSEILEIRRQNHKKLFYQSSGGDYTLWLSSDGFRLFCEVECGSSECTDFETYRKPFCNKPVDIISETVYTHDFSDDTTWDGGTSNSVSIIEPETAKTLCLHNATIVCDKNLDFDGNNLAVVVWAGITQPCPSSGVTRTPFNDVPFIPGVQAGWILYVKPWSQQEVNTYIYLSIIGTPLYGCTAFEYSSIDELIAKSDFKFFDNRLHARFDFLFPVKMRSSMNERIETYADNDTKILSLSTPYVPAKATFVMGTASEF